MHPARSLWLRMETIHAVTYFAEESRHAARDAGLRGFWMGYFGFRAAPLGAVSLGAVTATFANFAPSMVARSVPDVWTFAAPADLLDARASAAAHALRAAAPGASMVADVVVERLEDAVESGSPTGRPLFAANQALSPRDDLVERLWQACTALREHRGDGHVAALTVEGLDGLAAHVLFAGEHDTPAELLRDNRGWCGNDWDRAQRELVERALLDGDGQLTDHGRAVRTEVEGTTDRLARAAFAHLDDEQCEQLTHDLDPLAHAVLAAGIIPFPNPMGLPRSA